MITKSTIKKILTIVAIITPCNMALASADNLKQILATLQSQAQINYSTGKAQTTAIQSVTTKATSDSAKQQADKTNIKKELNSATINYSSAATICNLYTATNDASTTEQVKQDNGAQSAQCPTANPNEQYLASIFDTFTKGDTTYANPKISKAAANDLNYANIFYPENTNTSAVSNKFINSLEDNYKFYNDWLQYDPPPTTDPNEIPASSDLFDPDTISKIKDNPITNSDALNAVLAYEANYKSSVALRSIAITALQSISQERSGGAESALATQENLINEFTSTNWTNGMSKAGPLTIQKAQLILLAQIAKQQLQAHLDQERNTAILSAMLLKINAISDSTSTMMSKQKLARILKKVT